MTPTPTCTSPCRCGRNLLPWLRTFGEPDSSRLADFALRFYKHFGEGRQLVLTSGAGDLIELRAIRDEAQLIAAIAGVEADE